MLDAELHAFARTTAAVLLIAFAYSGPKLSASGLDFFWSLLPSYPIVPIHLTRGAWSILNIAAGALFVGQFVLDRHKGKQKDGICTKAE
jgi:hypothetical protein